TDLGTARLRTGQGQEWEEQVVARFELGSRRRSESIDLGLRRGQRFTVERGQTPDESIDKRVEVVIVQRAVHPAIALGDISVEIVTAKHDLKCPRAADQTREPFERSAARDQSDANLGVAEQAFCRLAKRMSQASTNSLPMPRVRPRIFAMLTTGVDERRSTKSRQRPSASGRSAALATSR